MGRINKLKIEKGNLKDQFINSALFFLRNMNTNSLREIEILKEKLVKVGSLGIKKIYPKNYRELATKAQAIISNHKLVGNLLNCNPRNVERWFLKGINFRKKTGRKLKYPEFELLV